VTPVFVTPARAGVPLPRLKARRGIAAFAAMTVMLLWLFLAVPAAAQTFPKHQGSPIVDQADLLRPEQELDLQSKAEALYAQTGRAFGVATVKSLEGRTIEDYGYRLGREWGLGDEKRDDGVILLVAPNERKVRIETGYGARVFLTDAVSSVIIRNSILPHFRKDPPDYGAGIVAGADQIIKMMSLSPEEARKTGARAEQQETRRHQSGAGLLPVLFIMIVFFSIVGSMARRARGRRYRRSRGGISPWVVLWGLNELSRGSRGGGWGGGGWSGGGGWGGGGGGGGFGGFGGGSFGGGGASGSW